MLRIALFVEGQTERVLFEYLLRDFFGSANVHIRCFEAWGGGATDRQARLVQTDGMVHAPVHILIRDCTGEGNVLSEVRDHFSRLAEQGFAVVMAITDLHPVPLNRRDEVRALRSQAVARLDTLHCRAGSVLSVHQAEAYFVLDRGHFARTCPSIDDGVITEVLGVPGQVPDVEAISAPASKIEEIYRRCGGRYDKSLDALRLIAASLDFELLFLDGRHRSAALDHFFSLLEDGIARRGGLPECLTCAPA